MSARPETSDEVVLVEFSDSAPEAAAQDGLALGRPPRPPLAPRTRRWVAAGVAVVAAAAVVGVLVSRRDADGPAPRAAAAPTAQSSAGFASGPVLVRIGGKDALQPAGLPGLGASVEPVVLEPAPDVVTLVATALPGFRDVRGGRIPGDLGHYGVYLAGTYDGANGAPVDVTLYTARAPGTTFGADHYVSRSRFDGDYTVRTDVSVFTGSGWWVHAVSLGPDDPGTARDGEAARLVPLAENPVLVAP